MNCLRLAQVLDAYVDGELDRGTGDEITQHLAQCPLCTARRNERDTLKRQLVDAPYYTAPDPLRQAVRRALARRPDTRAARGPSWLQAATLMVAAALVSALAGYWAAQPVPDRPLREQVVMSHVAALSETRRLTEIVSTDRHTVKPWFQGKLDFAPVVRDLSPQGYTLVGARLDHVGDHQAAAIVYRVRAHLINLFVWRAAGYDPDPLAVSSVRGFGVATWADGGLRFAAVSDADPRELERFARLVQSQP